MKYEINKEYEEVLRYYANKDNMAIHSQVKSAYWKQRVTTN